jgi:hypothetical protein
MFTNLLVTYHSIISKPDPPEDQSIIAHPNYEKSGKKKGESVESVNFNSNFNINPATSLPIW